ncbi:MAG: caspase family protein [Rhodocyclales bacterium]|nr:caspase family protein [Rhodocyclales bacterium]
MSENIMSKLAPRLLGWTITLGFGLGSLVVFSQVTDQFEVSTSVTDAIIGTPIVLTIKRSTDSNVCAVEIDYGDGDTKKRRLESKEATVSEHHSFAKAGSYKVTVSGVTQFKGLNIASPCPGAERIVTIKIREETVAAGSRLPSKVESQTSPLIAGNTKLNVNPSGQGRRIALVIGNGDYQYPDNLPKLVNPTHDAEDIAEALRGFGFEVIERKNQTFEAMNQAIAEFGSKIGGSEAALFYFAGHGIQVKNQNYLMPVSAKIDSEAAVPYQGVDMNRILDEMDNGKSGVNIVMLDACRNNPISGKFRSGKSRGLASPGSAPQGTVIVYATDPGNVAADGDGRNGLFSSGLLKAFKGGDLSLDGVLTAASEYVEKKSIESDPTRKQTPYVNGPKTVQKNFHFSGTTSFGKSNVSQVLADPEAETWAAAQGASTVAGYRSYLDAYPTGRYATAAGIKLTDLQKPATSPAPEPRQASCQAWSKCAEVASKACPSGFDVVSRKLKFEEDSDQGTHTLIFTCKKQK